MGEIRAWKMKNLHHKLMLGLSSLVSICVFCACWALLMEGAISRLVTDGLDLLSDVLKEGKLRERGVKERMSQGRRKKKMAGTEPVKRWGSINHEVNLLLMVMLASAIRLKQDKVLEAMASTLTMMLSLCSSSICIRSTCLITSSLRTSLSKSTPLVTSLEMAPSIKRAQQAQKTQ